MNKRPVIDSDLVLTIQKFANTKTDGNFTLAVNILLREALKVKTNGPRKIQKWAGYYIGNRAFFGQSDQYFRIPGIWR